MEVTQSFISTLLNIQRTTFFKKLRLKFKQHENGIVGKRAKYIVLKNFPTALFRMLWKDADYVEKCKYIILI